MGPVEGRHHYPTPGKTFKFNVRGDPGAKVNFVAVDNAVFLLSQERLTQSKVRIRCVCECACVCVCLILIYQSSIVNVHNTQNANLNFFLRYGVRWRKGTWAVPEVEGRTEWGSSKTRGCTSPPA